MSNSLDHKFIMFIAHKQEREVWEKTEREVHEAAVKRFKSNLAGQLEKYGSYQMAEEMERDPDISVFTGDPSLEFVAVMLMRWLVKFREQNADIIPKVDPDTKIYQQYAKAAQAFHNCAGHNNNKWGRRWLDVINRLDKELPTGSGFHVGCTLMVEESGADRLVIHVQYHPMGEHGGYVSWVGMELEVKPSLAHGFTLDFIKVRNPNDTVDYDEGHIEALKDYIYEVLNRKVPEDLYENLG